MGAKKLIIAGVLSVGFVCAASLYTFAAPSSKESSKKSTEVTTEATTEKKSVRATTEQIEKEEPAKTKTTTEALKKETNEKEEVEPTTEEVSEEDYKKNTDKDSFEDPYEYEDDSVEKCDHDWDVTIAYDPEQGYVWDKTCKKCHSVVYEKATEEDYEEATKEENSDEDNCEYVDDGTAEIIGGESNE